MIHQSILEQLATNKVTTAEIQSLRQACLQIKKSNFLVEEMRNELGSEFVSRLRKTHFLQDLEWFVEQFIAGSADQKRANVWWLLLISRSFGLVEFSRLRKLRRTKIRVLGASVAAATVELLASLGAEDIVCIDPGVLEVSNLARLPMGGAESLGKSKSEVLVERLLQINPYGKFRAIHGRVVCSSEEKHTKNDLTVEEFIADADIILEVIDDIRVKAFTHLHALRTKSLTPLLFIADLGNTPIVKVVSANQHGEVEKPFGRSWTVKERKQLEDVITLSKFQAAERAKVYQRAAYLMVKDDLPADHALQFLMSCVGAVPFWSQTPIASRRSAALAAETVLQEIDPGKDFSFEEQKNRITNVCQKFLEIS